MTKMRALGLGLLAAMALSIVGVVSAGADTGGHFTSDVSSTNITGIESGAHKLAFSKEGDANKITCVNAHYKGHVSGTTAESIQVEPTYSTCTTTSSEAHFEIHEEGCKFRFTIGKVGQTHHTVHVEGCTDAGGFRITHPNCTMRVPPQTVTGVVYNTTVENGKHSITVESTVQNITTHYEGGICIFLGTTHESEMSGSVTVQGFDTDGNQVNITATTG